MEKSIAALITAGLVAVAALAALAILRWRQRQRVRQVGLWVKDYLAHRNGGPAEQLAIHCSDDRLWPVLVTFRAPADGVRHTLQFSCPGQQSSLSLLSEKEECVPGA